MPVHIAVADMDVELAEFVLESTQTSGTGTYSLDGVSTEDADAGYRSFVSGVGSGNRTIYVARLGSTWEIGIGTVTSGAPDTLSRDYIFATSAGGSPATAIDWQTSDPKSIYIETTAGLLAQIPRPGEALWGGLASGNNVQAISVDPDVTAYFDGMTVFWRKGDTANTGNMQLNVNTIGAVSLLKKEGVQILSGEASADALMGATYVESLSAFIAIAGLSPLRLGSDSDNDVEIIRNDTTVIDLDGSGANVVSGTLRQDGNKVVAAPNIFESAEQTITAGSLTEVAHSLGGVPKQAWGVLRCKSADAGFSVGDEIETFAYRDPGTDVEQGVLVGADATNVFFTVGADGLRLFNKSSGENASLTNASWRVVLRAWI